MILGNLKKRQTNIKEVKMKTESALEMIRTIRDKNSARYLTMPFDKIKQEKENAVKWYEKQIGRPVTFAESYA